MQFFLSSPDAEGSPLVIYFAHFVFYSWRVKGHIVWKWLKMSHLDFSIEAFSTNFCPIESDLSGNTVKM